MTTRLTKSEREQYRLLGIPTDRKRRTVDQLAGIVLSIIENHPDRHNQSVWTNATGPYGKRWPVDCGTTCCVAGWAGIAAGWHFIGDFFMERNPGDERGVETVAANALGLDPYVAGWLFSADRTRDQVLAALRLLADGKELTWESCDEIAGGGE